MYLNIPNNMNKQLKRIQYKHVMENYYYKAKINQDQSKVQVFQTTGN